MASLLPTKTAKADAPLTAHAARIENARKGMAAGDNLWRSNGAVAPAPSPANPTQHLSGPGASTITGFKPQSNSRKADVLAALPAEVRRRAEGYSDGVKAFLALIHQRHAATKEAVSFTSADAAVVLDLPPERAAKAVEALAREGLIRPQYSRLGPLLGYVPATPT
ncbi:MAG: hypothetical protein DI629_12425 [Mesorhizobium amorphae]|nr:MAG: hypothetical protein DI629_12425 [Mesorhizobium amorphae]